MKQETYRSSPPALLLASTVMLWLIFGLMIVSIPLPIESIISIPAIGAIILAKLVYQ